MFSPSSYKRTPLRVKAVCITPDNIEEVAKWCKGSIKGIFLPIKERCIDIETTEGEMRAEMGDYILEVAPGNFFPVPPRYFAKNYIPI